MSRASEWTREWTSERPCINVPILGGSNPPCALCSPRVEIAELVVLSSLVVEAVNEFVTHDHANSAKVERLRVMSIVKWHLRFGMDAD